MRWIRLLSALLFAKFRSRLAVRDTSIINFRVWITDIDVTIMNHAAIMTMMEAGRIDYMVRSGFFRLARNKKWYFPSAAISTQFLRPLKFLQKATISTRVFHVSSQWIYLDQKVSRKNKTVAVCIVKCKIKKGRETIPTAEIVHALQTGPLPVESPELIAIYEEENRLLLNRNGE